MQEQAMQQQFQQQQAEEVLKKMTLQILDAKARERLYNLKIVKPDLALQLQVYLFQLYQSGQVRGKITDDQMVNILKKLQGTKETKIIRK